MKKQKQMISTPSSQNSLLTAYHNLQMKQLYQTFEILDEDHDGYITCSDMIELLSQIQVQSDNNLSYKYLLKLMAMKQQRKQFREKQILQKQKRKVKQEQQNNNKQEQKDRQHNDQQNKDKKHVEIIMQVADGQFKINKQMFVKIILGEIGQLGETEQHLKTRTSKQQQDNKNYASKSNTSKEGLKSLFQYYNDGQKQMGVDKIVKIVQRLGQPYSQLEIERWLRQFRVLRKGHFCKLNFQDFYELLMQKLH